MVEISLRGFFQDFNASKVLVYTSVLAFSILMALKGDGRLSAVPYWAIFLPLLLWKLVAVIAALVAIPIHRAHPPLNDPASELEYRSMLFSFAEHILLLLFEVMTVYKLESSNPHLLWIIVFAPLIAQSLLAIFVCIWAVRRDKSFEFELFFAVNLVEFVFLGLKLDGWVSWAWVVILIPLWILICLSVIGVLYAIVLAVLLLRSIELLPEHRRQHVFSAITYTFLVIPILIFLVLLTSKLDGSTQLPWLIVATPLYVSLLCLILISCGTRGGNQWWCGMRRDFCSYLLHACPCLREYGNVSLKLGRPTRSSSASEDGEAQGGRAGRRARAARRATADVVDGSQVQLTPPPPPLITVKDLKPVAPVVTIELPD